MTSPIAIIGATSGIGLDTVKQASARGLPVRAFARSADTLDGMPNVTPIPGDARQINDLKRLLDGADAVIVTLGIRERLAMLWEEETLFSESTAHLIELMQQSGPRRLVVVTGFGAGRSKSAMSAIERMGHRALLGKPYADKDRQEDLIVASDLDWTIARPVILTKGPKTENYRVLRNPAAWRNGLVSRADVAHYLLAAVTENLDVKGDVVLTR